jgi:hypothetical protein
VSPEHIRIIPEVVAQIRRKIESTKTLLLYRKTQLQQTQTYFHKIQTGNRQIIESKLKEHFAKLRKVMDDYEDRCTLKLEELL